MAVRHFLLVSEPPLGCVVEVDGQEYVFAGTFDYTNRDGESRTLRNWSTKCRTCEAPFDAPCDQRMTYLNRRCERCRPKKHMV